MFSQGQWKAATRYIENKGREKKTGKLQITTLCKPEKKTQGTQENILLLD